jgi:NodT family efflux transporter outer membrane factor (OMF) lipoprotein
MRKRFTGTAAAGLLFVTAACTVGPNYKKPSAPVPPAFKEQPPDYFKEANGWKQATPGDGQLKGKWWELFNDPQLNALEEQVVISNQNVLLAEAQYREAKAAVKVARSALFPTITAGPAITESRAGGSVTSGGAVAASGLRTIYSFPADVSWEPDLWGSIRRSIRGAAEQAQSRAADLENARLLYQSELAQDYFALHGLDGDIDLLNRTVASYQDYLQLTRNRFAAGVASDLDVAQAESQLYAAQTTLTDFGVARAQYEHAIAVLTGKPPAELTVAAKLLTTPPPPIPVEVPSALLERRPDIAANERLVASANEQIGIAMAAFYPTLALSASGGFQASRITTWLSWPSHFFSVGPSLAETLFDAGRRRGVVTESQAAYDATVAAYRQSVLTAFQQVEDELAAQRILTNESLSVENAVKSSQRALTVATAQYKAGTASYLTVITEQATALAAERSQIDLLTRRLTSAVLLIEYLGGGWDTSQLPTVKDVTAARR